MELKVYLIEKSSRYDNTDIFGIPFKNLGARRLGDNANIIGSEDQISAGKVTALLYNDTPLISIDMLKELYGRIISGQAKGFRLGGGYIKADSAGFVELSDNLPFRVTKVDSLDTLNEVIKEVRCEIIERHLDNGVIIHDPFSVHIDDSVTIGKGSIIYPMNYLRGNTKIGENVILYSYCDLTDTLVGDGTDIRATYAVSAKIGKKCTLGPFACLRKGAIIGNGCRVGDFVEIKNSTLEQDVKAAHLAYIGDSYVGENTNVGCGAIFANYDGKVKRSVIVGKNVFIGCNTNLVAPLEIDDGAYIAAGSTVTQNVPGNALCIARARQIVKNEWDRPSK